MYGYATPFWRNFHVVFDVRVLYLNLSIDVHGSTQGWNYREVCGGGVWHVSVSRRVYPYNFVGQILKIFECLWLKSNSSRKIFDKFTKIWLRNFTNYGKLFRKLVKNAMSGNFFYTPQQFWDFGKRNNNLRLKSLSIGNDFSHALLVWQNKFTHPPAIIPKLILIPMYRSNF
jgi:hypothetical protein